MQANSDSDRKKERQRYIEGTFARVGLKIYDLAEPTLDCLENWARFMLGSAKEPSASWNTPLLELCRAIEAEVASALGSFPGLEGLAQGTLGDRAKVLQRLDAKQMQRLRSFGVKVGFLSKELPGRMRELSRMRIAHGEEIIRNATQKDGQKALDIVKKVLPELVEIKFQLRGNRG